MPNLVGYARVSTNDQNLDLQLDALKRAGVARIWQDQGVSGTRVSRPELDKMLEFGLNGGDTLVVWKLDRLGRNTVNVVKLVEDLAARGIGFKSITEGLDSTGPAGKMMLTVMAAFAQLERDQIVERTKAGLQAAKAQGRTGGRPKSLDADKIAWAQHLKDEGKPVKVIAAKMGVSVPTVYRYLAGK